LAIANPALKGRAKFTPTLRVEIYWTPGFLGNTDLKVTQTVSLRSGSLLTTTNEIANLPAACRFITSYGPLVTKALRASRFAVIT